MSLQQSYEDNPAGRVWGAIVRARQVPGNETALKGWAEVFGLEPDDWPGVLACGAALAEEASRAIRLAESLQLAPHYAREWTPVTSTLRRFAQIEAFKMADFLAPWTPVADVVVEGLDYELHTRAPEPTIPATKRTELSEAVEDLLDRLVDGDLGDELSPGDRDFVVDHLALIRERLGWVPFTGSQPLRQAVDGLVGNIGREPGMWQRIGESAAGQVIGTLIVSLMLATPSTYQAPAIEAPDVTGNTTTVVNVINGSAVRVPALDLVEGTFRIEPRVLPGGDIVPVGDVDPDEGG